MTMDHVRFKDLEAEVERRIALQEEYGGTDKVVNRLSPIVSVVVLAYQHAPFVRQCLDGILMQETAFPVEVILGEDGSTDGTRETCIEYAERHPDRIRLFLRDRSISHMQVKGRDVMLNHVSCMRSARGKYIAICEGDDYWTDPLKLQKQVDFLEVHPEFVVCNHDAYAINTLGMRVAAPVFGSAGKCDCTGAELMRATQLGTLTVCFRNTLRIYPPEMLMVMEGDSFLYSLLGSHGGSGWLGGSIGPSAYRLHQGGIYSGLTSDQRERVHLNTFYWLWRYHGRLDEHATATYFSSKYVSLARRRLRSCAWKQSAAEWRSAAMKGITMLTVANVIDIIDLVLPLRSLACRVRDTLKAGLGSGVLT